MWTHALTTRIGGVSDGPFASLNLGNPPGELRDSIQNVDTNLHCLETALNLSPRQRASVHQVHGSEVAIVNTQFENGTPADAMVSSDEAFYLLIRIADCVPILLASPDGSAVAAVHAGWRGVVAEVLPHAVRALAQLANFPASQLVAAVGPCISREHFEVGPEVIARFVQLFGENDGWTDRHVDLAAAVTMQLRAAGITKIDRTDRCTFRDKDEFFSHRRDHGVTGRLAAVIAPVHHG